MDIIARHHLAVGIIKYFGKEITAEHFVDHYLIAAVRSKDSLLRQISRDGAEFFCEMHGFSDEDGMPKEARHIVDVLQGSEANEDEC